MKLYHKFAFFQFKILLKIHFFKNIDVRSLLIHPARPVIVGLDIVPGPPGIVEYGRKKIELQLHNHGIVC